MLKQTSFRKDGQNIFKQQQYEVSFIYLFFIFYVRTRTIRSKLMV
jgi:hypothetical protein